MKRTTVLWLLLLGACRTAAPVPAELVTDGRVALPSGTPVGLLVYMGGMQRADSSTDPAENRIVEGALVRGLAVYVPGSRGPFCEWQAKPEEWLCWPTNLRSETKRAAMERIASEASRIASRLGALPQDLVSFSNGGFSASKFIDGSVKNDFRLIMIINGGPADDFAIQEAAARDRVVILSAATGDQFQYPTMRRLRDALEKNSIEVEWRERDGEHPLNESDVEFALERLGRIASKQRPE